ncbi:MAG: stage III sporulation protein AB [Pseudoflavonifractor sp.]
MPMKLLGALLLAGGMAALGHGAVLQLDRRLGLLRGFCAALETMERELSFRLTDMPRLFLALSDAKPAPVGKFFASCHKGLDRLGERPLELLWQEALADLPPVLSGEAREVLQGLGGVLGRYDGENQREALALAASRLRACSAAAAEERIRMGKVYGTVSLTGGVLLTILLL